MKTHRPALFLTALPFMALFAAKDVQLGTTVEPDGTGIRRLAVTADPARRKTVEVNIARMDPDAGWIVRRRGNVAEEYRLAQDTRFTRPTGIADLGIARRTLVGGWPPVKTVYSYSDKITRTAYNDTEKERKAAAETEFAYSVSLPGEIDITSVRPAGGRVIGQTVTWTLKADQETTDIAVTSTAVPRAPLVFLLYLVLVLLVFGLRYGLAWRRGRPRRI